MPLLLVIHSTPVRIVKQYWKDIIFCQMLSFKVGVLRESLYEARVTPPPYTNQAHHIVAKNAEKATYSREVLESLDIDLNSASNGILLPSDRTATYAVTESIHNG